MIATLLVLGLPLFAAPLAYLLRRQEVLAAGIVIVTLAVHTFLLWNYPPATFDVLGRTLALGRTGRVFLISANVWVIGATLYTLRISQGWSIYPFWLVVQALFTGVFLFQDFVLRMLVFKSAWLLAILLIQSGTMERTRAATRMLIVIMLATPVLLAGGLLVGRISTDAADLSLAPAAGTLLALGTALILAIFPFHAWVPQATEDGPPLVTAWVVGLFGTVFLMTLVELLAQNPWVLTFGGMSTLLRGAGFILAISGGLFAFSETHLGRLWAYSILADQGYILLALSLGGASGLRIVLFLLGARLLALLLSGMAIATIRYRLTSLEFDALPGTAQRLPLTYLALLGGGLSFFGLPLSAGFAGHWMTLRAIFPDASIWFWGTLAATLLGVLGYVRALHVAVRLDHDGAAITDPEPLPVAILMLGVVALSSLIALAPQTLLPLIQFVLEALRSA
ncbi:hypothetical protein ARMA_1529 [Ardenticatena maritima]|uniref:NADH:quinone oxidoreductase/Mrp antiporter transmembrane domain-containing protein n=1 Tax=Ardenticatena maritima TaxID=872965 RepID=A0A0M8K9L9_9CHLR|nr:proton-conducting transporter membrane subunit [Ardenticatena maritima]KPL87812.1 hypothetical protein SE16_09630 [Ardenticatena maritima]GAP63106.1 hypothetical protein ARMA_1529 [Ardenticatena maritima]